MKISRFYQSTNLQMGKELELSGDNHRHAIQVLRLKLDDPLIIFNGKGGEYSAHIVRVEKRKSCIKIDSFDPIDRESNLYTRIFLAMIKADKMDFAIQKMVELGVTEIQPMMTKRSVINIKANRLQKKMAHWQGIILAACEQSGRTSIPVIKEPQSMDECIKESIDDNSFILLPGNYNTFAQHQNNLQEASTVSLLIGPEGGFTEEEVQMILECGIRPVNFGKRILRAETAAISGLTACQLYWGDLSSS